MLANFKIVRFWALVLVNLQVLFLSRPSNSPALVSLKGLAYTSYKEVVSDNPPC
jgi:hypothetical protein